MRYIVTHLSSPVKLTGICLFISLLIGQSGCATSKPYAPPTPYDLPLSKEVREKLGAVGVTSACFLPKAELRKPKGKWAGASTGVAGGFLATIAGGGAGGPYGLLLGLALAPVGAVVGGVEGAVEGVSSEQKKEAEEAVNKAISELNIQATMRDYVLRVAREKTSNYLIPLDVQGRDVPDKRVDYRFLSDEGIDTVLELSVPVFGLIEDKEGINPRLIFYMSLHTLLVRTSDGKVLYTQDLEYRGASRKFTDWASNNAKLYREEFPRCYQNLAEKVVKRIFLQRNLPLEQAPEIEMVFVKGGCFKMGDTFGGGKKDEKPVHDVCIKDFYIGKYEVTQEQWQEVMGNNPSFFRYCGYDCPVENVSWDDVQKFIRKLREMTQKEYRLPTEAEWEYAARSGGEHQQWAGTSSLDDLEDYAWYYSNSGNTTHPVGQKKPNGLGIYDMSGNVREWVTDYYDKKYYEKSPKENPPGPLEGSDKVLRGGSRYTSVSTARASNREQLGPSSGFFDIGLRLALPSR